MLVKLSLLLLALGCFSSLSAQEKSTGAKGEVDKLELIGDPEQHDDHATSGNEHDAGHKVMLHDDVTHGNVSDAGYEVVDFRTDLAFFTAIVFGLLVFGLAATVWKPIMQGLEKREHGIAHNIKQAEDASRQAKERLVEYDAKLSAAAAEAQQMVADARKSAEAAGQKLIASAQEEAARQRERAVAEIESAKRQALGEMARQSTDMAMTLAQRVVGREVNPNDHQGLIQDMLAKLPSKN